MDIISDMVFPKDVDGSPIVNND